MRTRKAFAVFTICALSALSIPDVLSQSPAASQPINTTSEQASCSKLVTGTYLTTISTSNGAFASRSLITLTPSGNILVADSNQNGVPGAFGPFGEAQGAWKCTRNGEITATTLNFSYPTTEGSSGSIGKSNYSIMFKRQTQVVQGTIKLRFFDLNANPQESDGSDGGTFTFTGQRVTAE
ncbi:MAG: hypothetical protein PUP92_20525 [Rhizonema sp. PD38]|nr:hypothetical protein [Rhizonema sp. PD38]